MKEKIIRKNSSFTPAPQGDSENEGKMPRRCGYGHENVTGTMQFGGNVQPRRMTEYRISII